jgi:hypothetical protein
MAFSGTTAVKFAEENLRLALSALGNISRESRFERGNTLWGEARAAYAATSLHNLAAGRGL